MQYEHYDIIVIGGGPAGLSAAINAKIRNRSVLVVEQGHPASALKKAAKIDNYLGLPGRSGGELLELYSRHARDMDIETVQGRLGGVIYDEEDGAQVLIDDDAVSATALILATGAPYQTSIPGEDDYVGRGLGYCATCDGPLYKDRLVLIVAYGAEAEEEANFMAEICSRVYYLPMTAPQGELDARIELLPKSKPEAILADDKGVRGLRLKDGQEIAADGVFILGAETAPTRLLAELELDGRHIKTDRDMATALPGVFAAGDCAGQPYQLAKAVGEGLIAGQNAARYVARKNK